MEKIKIFFYTNHIDRSSGGSTYSILTTMKKLEEKGYKVGIIVNKRRKEELEVDYPIISIDANLGDINRHIKLREILNKENPDIVFSNMLTQNITLSLAKGFRKKKVKAKCIGIVRGASNYIQNKSWWKFPYRIWMKKVFENLDCVIAISEYVKKDLIRAFFLREEKIKVIYNPFDLKIIKQKAEEPLPENYRDIFEKYKILINVGRLSPQKRQDLLIETFDILRKKYPDFKLVLIGGSGVEKDDKYEKFLRKLVKDKDLEKDVLFLGHQMNPYKFIKHSHLFVLTSEYEGLARVIIESLAVKTPVVAFNSEYANHTEIFGKNSENLVPFPDIKKLAEKIEEILNNPQKYEKLKKEAPKIAERFSAEKSADEYDKFIKNILYKNKC